MYMQLFKIRHVYGPTGFVIRECRFAAKNAKRARIAYEKRFNVGIFDFIHIWECQE